MRRPRRLTRHVIPPQLVRLLDRQKNLVTRAQVRAAGVSDAATRWALSRQWQLVLPGVIHVYPVTLTREQRLIAALLYCGEHAVVNGPSAAAWYGLEHADDRGVVRVLVPRRCSARDIRWISVARSGVPFDQHTDGPRRFTSPTRAVVEAARTADGPERAEAIVIEAVMRRLVRLEHLADMNSQLGRRGSRLAELAIRAAAQGAWSIPESGLYRLTASSSKLPDMWCNPDLFTEPGGRRLITPDGWFDDVGLALMVHSRRWHDGQRWAPTVERDGDLVAQGIRVLPLAPTSIATNPKQVLARVEQAYGAAKAAGARPAVRAVRWRGW